MALAVALALGANGCATLRPSTTGEIPVRERRSILRPRWVWTDEQGESVSFERWRGIPLVVTAVYTSCTTVCPRTVAKLRRVYDAYRREEREAQFLLVTLDPTNDSPEVLQHYKTSMQLPSDWHLLRGSPSQTQELVDLLDVHLIDDAPHIAHESKVVFFDKTGTSRLSFACCDFPDDIVL